MTNLPRDVNDWTDEDQAKVKRNLNRLYWIVIFLAVAMLVYLLGWYHGYISVLR